MVGRQSIRAHKVQSFAVSHSTIGNVFHFSVPRFAFLRQVTLQKGRLPVMAACHGIIAPRVPANLARAEFERSQARFSSDRTRCSSPSMADLFCLKASLAVTI